MRNTGCLIAVVPAMVLALVLGFALVLLPLPPMGIGPAAEDYSFRLSGGYELSRSSAHQVRIHPTGAYDPTEWPEIPARVEAIAWDHNHILAVQRPPRYFGKESVPPGECKLWILDVQARKLNGPLTRAQFDVCRSALGVAERLHLKPVRRPRNLLGW